LHAASFFFKPTSFFLTGCNLTLKWRKYQQSFVYILIQDINRLKYRGLRLSFDE